MGCSKFSKMLLVHTIYFICLLFIGHQSLPIVQVPKLHHRPNFLTPKEIATALEMLADEKNRYLDLTNSDKKEEDTTVNHLPDDYQHKNASNDYEARSKHFQVQLMDVYHWPNATVPYVLDMKFGPEFRIFLAMQVLLFSINTCVRFVTYDSKKHAVYLKIINAKEKECSADVALTSGPPEMRLNEQMCRSMRDIAHEMMHVLGFRHEHQREDRDNYIIVQHDNIKKTAEAEFEKEIMPDGFYDHMPYDTTSVLHYSSYAFVKTKGNTSILARNQKNPIIPRNHISQLDYNKVNLHYRCGEMHKDCKDTKSREFCMKNGLGLRMHRNFGEHKEFMFTDEAKCSDLKFAYKHCIRSCGQCHILEKDMFQQQLLYNKDIVNNQ